MKNKKGEAMREKILKVGLGIGTPIFAIIIVHFLFFTNQKYMFPVEIGKLELNDEIRQGATTSINCFPADVLELLDQIEQEQSYVNIEELEQLRENIESIDAAYIVITRRRPLRYIRYYDENKPILGDLSDGWGSFGSYGEDNGNVLYFYRVRQKIVEPYDGNV